MQAAQQTGAAVEDVASLGDRWILWRWRGPWKPMRCLSAAERAGAANHDTKSLVICPESDMMVLFKQVAQVAQQQEAQQTGATGEDMVSLKDQVDTLALAGAKEAKEVAQQLSALGCAQHATCTDVAAAQAQLRMLSNGLAQANIALADMQDALEESGMGPFMNDL